MRPRVCKRPKRACFVLDRVQHENIQRIARQMSFKEGRNYNISDLVRMALDIVYPIPNETMEFKW